MTLLITHAKSGWDPSKSLEANAAHAVSSPSHCFNKNGEKAYLLVRVELQYLHETCVQLATNLCVTHKPSTYMCYLVAELHHI